MSVMEERLAVCRLSGVASREELASLVPGVGDSGGGSFLSITRTPDELSIVCAEDDAPENAMVEGGWRAMKVEGPLDFPLVGILVSISAPLAEAGVSIFAVSTFDTDYVLVKEENLERAVSALEGAGHVFETSENVSDT